jgi:3-oxoacyl-(acyl-carrier-protein) synthase
VIFLTETGAACTESLELLDDIQFPQQVHWVPETFSRIKSGMIYVPHKMAERVMDSKVLETLRENPIKTAFIFAAGNTQLSGLESVEKTTRLTYQYKFAPFTLCQVYAGRMAQFCGATDLVMTDSTACASSLKVMMDVQNLIRFYGFHRVVVLAVEDQISNSTLRFFGETQACLSHKEETENNVLPSAFDSKNYGFHIGQGAAFAVFETETSMKLTGFKPKAVLMGAYTASEQSTNSLGQREDGEGFKKAIEGALYVSQTAPHKVKTVKTHGTGTKSNNIAEKHALTSTLKDFVATSFKQRIGHTLGTSGLLETILLLDNVKNGFVPPILNRTDEDKIFLSEPAPFDKDGLVLSLAAGMGNVYSAAIFKDAQC